MTFRGNSRSASAFTLAELLIVVGIIAILAAIAVSNYALVSVRSKVARVHSELRTLAGAIEMYNVDHDRQPRMADFVFYGDVAFDTIDGVVVRGVMSKALSTPIAYATNAHVRDPLMDGNSAANLDEQIYTYHDLDSYIHHEPNSSFWPRAKDFYGEWRLISVGPDLDFGHGFSNSAQLPYDPTNGTVSLGNIIYAHNQDRGFPPDGILGIH